LLLVLALVAPADAFVQPPAPPLQDADYLAFADSVMAGMERRWDPVAGAYVTPRAGATARTNANALIVHSAAALAGGAGAARHDDRAHLLVAKLTQPPMLALSTGGWTKRTLCWTKLLTGGGRDHVSLDPQVAEALAWAWRARIALQLTPAETAAIVAAVDRCAHLRAWRYPHMLENQFNWNAQLYASAASVTGRPGQLRISYRRYLARFIRGMRRALPGWAAPNLGPGYGFHYDPDTPASRTHNFHAPEYSHIVASALQHYPAALQAGMKPLLPGTLRLVRRWVARMLYGDWTHAGYLNWDTGLGRGRWHSGQYWAFAQQGLLAIAATPAIWPRAEAGAWAKALFDRGLALYARWAQEGGQKDGLAPQLPFDIWSEHRDHDLYATRMAANAVRAIGLGLGDDPAADPPALFDYDVESQRLAVSTPSYSTAIVPRNWRAFPYGGIELARLYGTGQRVLGTTGGLPPAAFGVVVSDAQGQTALASQSGAPPGARLRLSGRKASSGSFHELRAVGRVAAGRLSITTRHRFLPDAIEERWDVACAGPCGPYTVDVLLPSYGRDAGIAVQGEDGAVAPLTVPRALEGVARVQVGGYGVTPLGAPGGALLLAVPGTAQVTAPEPGPTLFVRLVAGAELRRVGFGVRITP
jgi:hypothetical protein